MYLVDRGIVGPSGEDKGLSAMGQDARVEVPEEPRPQGVRSVFPFAVVGEVSRPCLCSLATG